MTREQTIAALVALGQDPEVLAAMDEPSLTELYRSLAGPAPVAMAEPCAPGKPPASATMAEPVRPIARTNPMPVILSAATIRQYAEGVTRATLAKERATERKRSIDEFCLRMVKDGKLTPAQT